MTPREAGRRLKAMREARGWSTREAAERIGVSYSYVSILERGGVEKPAIETLQKVARAYGVELRLLADMFGLDVEWDRERRGIEDDPQVLHALELMARMDERGRAMAVALLEDVAEHFTHPDEPLVAA